MYKYLIFDLDDTLLDFKKAEATAISTVLKSFGVSPTKEIIELYSTINISCWKRYEKGEITRNEIFENRVSLLGEALGVRFNADEFTKNYCTQLSKQGHTLPFALPLLKQLKAKGYKMAAATNGTLASQTGRLLNSGIAGFFTCGIYISEVIGLKKPDPEFFEFILNKNNIKNKSNVLVIGDSPSSDIAGAISAGLDCCFLNLQQKNPPLCNATYTVNSLEEIIKTCSL